MKKLLKKIELKKFLLAFLTVLVFFLGISIYLKVASIKAGQDSKTPDQLKEIAQSVVQKCSSQNYHPACYDEEIPNLMNQPTNLSMENAFAVIKDVQDLDSSYWFCHAAGHKLSTKEYQKDPSNWQSIMTRCEVGICSNGCLHGALQAHYSSETLDAQQLQDSLPGLKNLCEKRVGWDPTPLQQASCYHEIGHLSLFLTNADILRAKDVCDKVGVKDDGRNYLQTCYEGIFMQVFEPREPDDFSLIYKLIPVKQSLASCEQYTTGIQKGACWKAGWQGQTDKFCDTFSDELRNACYRESWVINDTQIDSAQGILNFCQYSQDSKETRNCYNKLFYSLMAKTDFNLDYMEKICRTLPDNVASDCFADTSTRMVETDKRLIPDAIKVCQDSSNLQDQGDQCYHNLSNYMTFIFAPGSDEAQRSCQLFPSKWQSNCLHPS